MSMFEMPKDLLENDTQEDDENLVPATDEEISEAIKEVLDEMQEEFDEMFSDEAMDEWDKEHADYYKEFEEAKTVEERTAVMDKYGIDYQV